MMTALHGCGGVEGLGFTPLSPLNAVGGPGGVR
jgi:hypothetical protein